MSARVLIMLLLVSVIACHEPPELPGPRMFATEVRCVRSEGLPWDACANSLREFLSTHDEAIANVIAPDDGGDTRRLFVVHSPSSSPWRSGKELDVVLVRCGSRSIGGCWREKQGSREQAPLMSVGIRVLGSQDWRIFLAETRVPHVDSERLVDLPAEGRGQPNFAPDRKFAATIDRRRGLVVVEHARATQVCGSLLDLVIADLVQRDSLRNSRAFDCRRQGDGWTYCAERFMADDARGPTTFIYDETGLLGVGRGRPALIGSDVRRTIVQSCP